MITSILKTSLGCLFIALLLNAAFTFAQGLAPGALGSTENIKWLQLNYHNPKGLNAFMPQYTVIITSARPTVKQLQTNRWEISFSN